MARGYAWLVLNGPDGDELFYNGQKAQEKAAGWSGTVVRKFSTLQGASDAYRLMQGKRDASATENSHTEGTVPANLDSNRSFTMKIKMGQLMADPGEEGQVHESDGACVALRAQGFNPEVKMSFDRETQELDLSVALK